MYVMFSAPMVTSNDVKLATNSGQILRSFGICRLRTATVHHRARLQIASDRRSHLITDTSIAKITAERTVCWCTIAIDQLIARSEFLRSRLQSQLGSCDLVRRGCVCIYYTILAQSSTQHYSFVMLLPLLCPQGNVLRILLEVSALNCLRN